MWRQLLKAWYRLNASVRRGQLERDIDDEVAFHLSMARDDLAASAGPSGNVPHETLRRFGNVARIKEQMRGLWSYPLLDSICNDVWYTIRNMRRQAGFTATVVLVLGAVIGLNTTLFTVVAGVTVRPWPGIADPSQVVRAYLIDPSGRAAGFSLPDYRELAGRSKAFSGVAVMGSELVRVGAGDAIASAQAAMVSGNFFDVLGVRLARGRRFEPDDDQLGRPAGVTILSYGFWLRHFGSDANVVGRSVTVNGRPFTILGVVSLEFGSSEAGYEKDLYFPMSALSLLRPGDPTALNFLHQRDTCCSDIVARLAPGTSRAQAQAELAIISRGFVSFSGNTARGVVVTGTEFLSQPGRADSTQALLTITLLTAALMLVWLIACANVANLLLARAAARTGEIGIRLALGAGRTRLIRQLLTEGFVLAAIATALGVAVAYELPFVAFRMVAAGDPAAFFPFSVAPDLVVLGYAVFVAGMSSIAFGLAPALYASRSDVARSLGYREGLPASKFPLRGFLLALQVSMSVILLLSAGLLIRGVQRQTTVFDPGFTVDGVTSVSFRMPEGVYDRARATTFFLDLGERIRGLPVENFAFASHAPFSLYRQGTLFYLPGESREQARQLLYLDVSPRYLSLLRIPLLAGRYLDASDVGQSPVVVNQTMARRYWRGESPVGKTFFMRPRGPADTIVVREVVGVVRDVHTNAYGDVAPMFYQAFAPGADVFDFISNDARASQAPTLLLKGGGHAAVGELARLIGQLDGRVRIEATSLSSSLDTMLASGKWGPIMAAFLGVFALGLATVGMFGVFAYAVRQRAREIGIRMALGAQPSAVVRLVLAGHSFAIGVGLLVGVFGAAVTSMALRNRLHGLSPFDPTTYLAVGALLACSAFAASYVPARRATRVNPLEVLRNA
jgi:predicted permease